MEIKYEEIDKMDYKRKNKYKEIHVKANAYLNKLDRIDKIKAYLLKNSAKLKEVEKLLYER